MVEKSAAEKLMTTINADGSINAKPVKLSWWSSKFGSLLSPQDLALVSGALVAAYLFAGENAVLVCDTFTSLPAVLFSYKLLTNDHATKAAYEATICFWIIHGTLAVVDHFLLKTVWYMFVKFLLMSAVSSHVVAQIKKRNPEFAASISLESHESVNDADVAESKSKIIMQNTKKINAEQPKSTIHEATMVSKGSQTLSAAILHLARGLNQDVCF
ncbi:Major sperm protein [Ditylenchus destructor]|nr:Major sperm protein [Ditylenchus destructor]